MRQGLVISDLHSFGAYGLTPKNFRASCGSMIPLNMGQEYLLECYNNMVDNLPEVLDFLVLNGDMIEGQNYFEQARMLSETDPTFQARGAAYLLEPITNRVREIDGQKMIYLMRGSPYHVGRGGWIEEVLGDKIGAIQDEFRRCTHAHVRFKIENVIFDCSHKQSFTSRYRTMPLEREIGYLYEHYGRTGNSVDFTAIFRSHTHSGYRVVVEENAIAVSTPCFKLQDDYAKTSWSPTRIKPDNVGAVGVTVNPEDSNEYIRLMPYLYKHPENEVRVLYE